MTQELFDKSELIRSLLVGKMKHSIMLASDFDSFETLENICILPQLEGWRPTIYNPHYYNVIWKARIIQVLVHHNFFTSDQRFFLSIFQNIDEERNLNIYYSLFPVLTDPGDTISQTVGMKAIDDLLLLQEKDKNLVIALQPTINICMRKISQLRAPNRKAIFEKPNKQIKLFELYRGMKSSELQLILTSLDFLNDHTLRILMQQVFLFQDFKTSFDLQKTLSSLDWARYTYIDIQDPNCLKLTYLYRDETNSLSDFLPWFLLANVSASKNQHFIEIQFERTQINLKNGQLLKLPNLNRNEIDAAFPFFFVALFDRIYPNNDYIQKCFDFIENNFKSFYNSKPFQKFIQAFRYDAELVSSIKQSLGFIITMNDIATQSIPKLLKSILFKDLLKTFPKIFDRESYLIGEKEMQNSKLLLHAINIYCPLIKFVTEPNFDLKSVQSQIRGYAQYIEKDKLQSILIDLYSLIFLTDSKGEYFCNIKKAQAIIAFLLQFYPDGNNLLKESNMHLYYAIFRNEDTLKAALISNQTLLIELIKSNRFEVIKTMVSDSTRFQTLIQLVNSLHYQKIETNNLSAYHIEKFLSSNEGLDGIELENQQKYYTDQIFNNSLYLIELHQLYKCPISLYKENPNLLHTNEFKNYLELYKKFEISLGETESQATIRRQPEEIVRSLEKSEFETNMNMLITLLGSHALEFVLTYSNTIDDKIFKIVQNESPVTAEAVRYEYAKKKQYTCMNENTVFERLLAKISGESDEIEIISVDSDPLLDQKDSTLESLTQDEILNLIHQYISKKPLNFNVLNDLYLRSPKLYTETMLSKLESFELTELLELYPFCGMRSLPYLMKLGVKRIIVVSITNHLLAKMQWKILRLFMDDFPHEDIYQLIFLYLKNTPEMLDLTPKWILDNIDTDLIERPPEIIPEATGINTLRELINSLENDVEFEATAATDVTNRLFQAIVLNDQSDQETISHICKASLLFNKRYKMMFGTKLKALSNLLSNNIHCKLGTEISLANFQNEIFGSNMASLLLKYDYFRECKEFCAAWSLDLSIYKVEIAKMAFQIGILNDGYENIQPPIRNDQIIDEIVDILSHKLIYDMSSIIAKKEIELIKKDLIDNYKNHKLLELAQDVYVDSDQIKTLHKILINVNSIDKLIMFYASAGKYDIAFDTWNTIQRRQTKFDLFIRSIVYPCIISGSLKGFWTRVKKNFTIMKPFVMDFFKYLDQRNMGLTSYEIQYCLSLYEMAFKTAYRYFTSAKSWDGQQKILNAMKKALKELKKQNQNQFIKEEMKIEIEEYLVTALKQDNVPYDSEINILSTKENALKASVFLLKRGDVELVISKLLPMVLFTSAEMCNALIDSVNGKMNELLKFLKFIQNIDSFTYEAMVMNLFQAIQNRVDNPASLLEFIEASVREDFKGRIMITFGFLERAYDIALKTNDEYLKELILDDAAKKQDTELIQRITSKKTVGKK